MVVFYACFVEISDACVFFSFWRSLADFELSPCAVV